MCFPFVGGIPRQDGKIGLRCRHPLLSIVHRLTGWKARPAVIYRVPSIPPSVVRVRRLSRGLRSAVRRPYSFIRSLFVDGLPTWQTGKPALCALPSAVHIRLFVPSFVDGLPTWQTGKPALSGLPSAVHIRLFVPSSLTVCLPGRLESLPYSALPPAVHIRLFVPSSLTVCLPGRLESLPYSALPSAVHIRLFVPSFVDGLPTWQTGKPALQRPAVRRPYSFIRSLIR